MYCTLKGCDTLSFLSQPFRLEDNTDRVPGAMPRAMLSDPFGVKKETTATECRGAAPIEL